MEFKISEKSQRNFEQLCKNIGAKEYMSSTDLAKYEENEQLLREEAKKQRIKRKEKMGFFKTSQMLIDYVLSGNKIYGDETFLPTDDYMYFSEELNCIVHYSLHYSDCDIPLGMGSTYMSIEKFIEWANEIGKEEHLEDGYLPYWYRFKRY